jgi:hypothetical protein
MKSLPWFPLAGAVILLAGGCASHPSQTTARVADQKMVTPNYRWVLVTGSHIPVAVPTDPAVRGVPSISPLSVYTPEEIRQYGGPLH